MRVTISAMALMLLCGPLGLSADQAVEIDLSSLDHPAIGSATAPVTIIEFSDFECPNCRRLEPALEQLRLDYGNRVRIVWMDFPLPQHRHAMLAAIAARCAGEQGKFWTYHDALMSDREPLGEGNLKDLADRLGLDPSSFGLCIAQRKYQGVVESDIDAGDAAGLAATPSLVINGRLYTGGLSLGELKVAVDKASAPPTPHAREAAIVR